MCYEISRNDGEEPHFVANKVLAESQTRGAGKFYFDAGQSRRELYVTYDELKGAFERLGLIQD